MQARKARARMIRIVTWREDKHWSVCARAIKEDCEYVVYIQYVRQG